MTAAEGRTDASSCHVNLFPSTLIDTPTKRLLQLFLPVEGRRFCVELSEQQFIGDPAYLREPVRELRAAGIEIAIDDVGFGRSSLEALVGLEPDVVKIDRKYVHGVARNGGRLRKLRRLAGVIGALGARAVAEGIERREDLEVVQGIGIEYGQGWLWGRPDLTPSAPA